MNLRKSFKIVSIILGMSAPSVMAIPLAHQVFKGRVTTLMPEVQALQVQQEDQPISMNFTLNRATLIRWHGKKITFTDLQAGDPVRVDYYGIGDVYAIDLLRPKPKPQKSNSSP